MKITKEEVLHIAHLSRLAPDEAELAVMQEELAKILDYMNTLSAWEEGREARGEALPTPACPWREDEVAPSFARKALLSQASVRREDSVIVPRTVE